MDNDSTTDGADNQEDASKANLPDPNASTDSGTDTDKTGADNSDASKSTDKSGDADKTTTTDKKDETPAPKFDTDLDEWAEKTKRAKPTTDRERELYQEIRNSQRDFSRSRQAKDSTTQVDKAIADVKPADTKPDPDDDDRDPVEIRQDNIEAQLRDERHTRLRGEYFAEKSVTTEESEVMGTILKEKVERAKTPEAKKQAFDYWTSPDNLEDWHALAKARLSTNASTDTSAIEEEAARKERARIAKESQAAGGTRNATNNGPQKPKGYDRTEYLKSDKY